MDPRSETVRAYMENIQGIGLISRAEECDLAARIATGDAAARSKLIVSNLRLVVKIAHDYRSLGLPLPDLISEGNIGLMRAADKFDPAKGAKFSSYAAWWIKQAMRRGLSNQSRIIRIPVQSSSRIHKIRLAQHELRDKLGRDPSPAEVAKDTGFSLRTITSLGNAGVSTISLQSKLQEGEDGELGEKIADSSAVTADRLLAESEVRRQMQNQLIHLSDRERLVLELRFGLLSGKPRTLEETSAAIGRTRERVRQIQNQALKKLRGRINADLVDFD